MLYAFKISYQSALYFVSHQLYSNTHFLFREYNFSSSRWISIIKVGNGITIYILRDFKTPVSKFLNSKIYVTFNK